MNHLPEKHADDPIPPPPPPREPTSVSPPPAVSSGDAIHNHYYDVNAHQEKEQSSSSSDSDSDDGDFFQVETTEFGGTAAKPPTAPIFMDNNVGLSVKHFGRKPPPPARYDVPDPNRIPMSVFARNTATASPKDWSVASNESLFSIQMGNSSFSREQGLFLMGRSEDLGNFASGSLEYPPPRPPPARGAVEGKAKLVYVEEVKEDEEEATKEKEKTGYSLARSISRQSDCISASSFRSFAFPILEEGKSESIKFMPKQHTEHQPPPLINPLNAPTTTLTAPKATPAYSNQRGWFPCFSWCQLCT